MPDLRKVVPSKADGTPADLASATQVGEVQANPTANTVLARLKDIAAAIAAGGAGLTDAQLRALAVAIQIEDSLIQVPSDIQGATIQVPVDVQAIYRPQHQSTAALLGIAGVYTSTAQSSANYAAIAGMALADVAGTLTVQQVDAAGTYRTLPGATFAVLAGVVKTFVVPTPVAANTRIQYTNGATGQASFSLQSYFTVN